MVAKVNGDTKSYTLKDLKTATKYKIWVVSHTAVGDGPPSKPIVVETEEDGTYTRVASLCCLIHKLTGLLFGWQFVC